MTTNILRSNKSSAKAITTFIKLQQPTFETRLEHSKIVGKPHENERSSASRVA